MSKIIRNTSSQLILVQDTGISIAAGASYTIPAADDYLWASSSNVIQYIGNGSLKVNDGTSDLSSSDGVDLLKGLFPKSVQILGRNSTAAVDVTTVNSKNRLAVDAVITTKTNPCLSKKYRIDTSAIEQPINGSVYLSVWKYTGQGQFFGAHIVSDSDKAEFMVLVDGETIFTDISIVDVKAINLDKSGYGAFFQIGGLFSTSGLDFDFSPPYPIEFMSSVEIRTKKTDNGAFKIKSYFVQLTKEG